MIALAYVGIPFSVTLPFRLTSKASDICMVEAPVSPRRTFMNMWNDATRFDPVVNLLLHKS